jgi:hypothetical protein
MAETTTLLSVIDRLKTEGDLDRDSGSNSIKSLKESVSSIVVGIKKELTREGQLTRNTGANSLKSLKDSIVGNDLAKAEKEKERQSLLQSIAANIGKSNDIAEDGTKNKPKEQKGFFATLLKIFPAIGVGIGGVLAKIPGFTKLKSFFGKTGTLGKFLPVLKKLALPLVLAFAAFKGILGGIKGYKEGGIMGAIKGFFIGVFDSIIGDTLKLVGGFVEKFAAMLGFERFGKMFNDSIGNIVEGVKGLFSGIFDAVKALFGGDTAAFKEALAGIWESVKKIIVGDGEGGGLFGLLKNQLTLYFKEIPAKLATFLTETLFPFLKDTLLPKLLEVAGNIAKVLGKVFTEDLWPYLKDTLLPKMLEIAGNVGKVIGEVFTELISSLKETILNLIPEPLKKAGGFIKGLWPFGKKEDDLTSAKTDAKLEELRTTDTTGFSEDQQAALGLLKDALADATTEEDRIRLAAKFQAYKVEENRMGAEGLFSDEFKKEQARLFSENRNNTGAQMEMGMAEIANAKSQPPTVIVSEGSSPQTTTVNTSTTHISGSAHQDESLPLIASAAAAGAW